MLPTTMRPAEPGFQGGVRMTLSPGEVRAAMIGGCGLRTLVAVEEGDPTAQALYRAALVKFQNAGLEFFRPAEATVSPDTFVPAEAEITLIEVVTEEGVM